MKGNTLMDFLKSLLANPKAAVRSALTTVVSVAAFLVALQALGVDVPAGVLAAVAGGVTVLRTLVAALDSGNTSFGRGA